MRKLCCCLLLALLCGGVFAAHAARAGAEFGILKGAVTFEDGLPDANVEVTAHFGDTVQRIEADANGLFQRLEPAGKATLSVAGTTVEVTVVAGEVTNAKLVVKRSGVLLTVAYPDGTPAENLAIYCQFPVPLNANAGTSYADCAIGKGRYWLRDVPADAMELTVYAFPRDMKAAYGNFFSIDYPDAWNFTTKSWKLEKTAPLREVTMTVNRDFPVKLRLLDNAGNPLVETPVFGSLSFEMPAGGAHLPYYLIGPKTTDIAAPASIAFTKLTTDINGNISLGNWLPRSYTLTLRTAEVAGKPAGFTVAADGTASIMNYTLNLGSRTVTQTVFGADGKLLPHAALTASYAWKGKMLLAQATADDTGKVTWPALPPVPVIVWGEQTPAGVIPAEATAVTAPLPAPAEQKTTVNWQVKLTLPDGSPFSPTGETTNGGSYYLNTQERGTSSGDFVVMNGTSAININTYELQPGKQFSLFCALRGTSPRAGLLAQVYAPLVSEGELEITVPMIEAPHVSGKFVTAAGAAAPGINQFGVQPVDPLLKSLFQPNAMGSPRARNFTMLPSTYLHPVEQPDGQFDILLPAPGAYRLQVDLFEENEQPLPTLLFTAKPGLNKLTVTLPAPLCEVPAGSEVSWVTYAAPAKARHFFAAAYAPSMPVFGPKERVLALWYRPSPDKLAVLRPAEGLPPTTLTLRSVALNAVDAAGQPLMENLEIGPLLPPLLTGQNGNAPAAETFTAALPAGVTQNAALWTGVYPVMGNAPQRFFRNNFNELPGMLTTVTVPATGDPAVTLKIAGGAKNAEPEPMVETQLSCTLPPGNYGPLGGFEISNKMEIDFDQREGYVQRHMSDATTLIVNPPAGAKNMTLRLPGFGLIQHVPLPAVFTQPLVLPPWQPDTTVSGQLLKADGKPWANQQLTCMEGVLYGPGISPSLQERYRYNNSQQAQTDAQGHFTLKNAMSGVLYLAVDGSINFSERGGNNWGTLVWIIEVPAKGLADLTLHTALHPSLLVPGMLQSTGTSWWIPDAGKPVLLPTNSNNIMAMENIPGGTGTIWMASGAENRRGGASRLIRLDQQHPAANEYRWGGWQGETPPSASALGLFFPCDALIGLPGAVTLTGLGAYDGIVAKLPDFAWQPLPALGLVVGQLDAVPPGQWRVSVDTPRGAVSATVTMSEYGGTAKFDYPK